MSSRATGSRIAFCIAAAFCTRVGAAELVMRAPDSPGGTPEIVGGRPANPEEWRASFGYDRGDMLCSATAIGARTILTAAHCIAAAASGSVTANGFSTGIL